MSAALIVDEQAAAPTLNLSGDSLFLDLDGTLAPLAPRPQDVTADAHRNRLLAGLAKRMDGRLAVVSGRTIDDVDRILSGAVQAVAGVHGLTRRTGSGLLIADPPHPGLTRAGEAFRTLAATDPGLLVEDKTASIALHFRGAPGRRDAALALADCLAAETGLAVQHGAAVVELRTPGPDKGDAVAAFLAESPFTGTRPVFVGDDVTDEDAFRFVERVGGMGVLVGPARETAATHRLADVAAVLAWLEETAHA